MQQNQLTKILADHLLWLQIEPNGIYANLSGANLIGANLSEANLIGANLSEADLIGADLSKADLSGANLIGANLSKADLIGADLSNANLSGANLINANLWNANLRNADLRNAVSINFSFLAVYGIGSGNRQTLYIPEMDIVFCGCFKGTMAQFKEQVASNVNGKHLYAYNNAIEYLEKQAVIYRKD